MTDSDLLVRIERDDPAAGGQGTVAVIRLDRPPVNAINSAMHGQLAAAAATVSADPVVRAVVLYGGPRAFAAGADIKEMVDCSPDEMAAYIATLSGAIDAVAAIRQPVIAGISRYALGGGCELALAADFRVIGADALIGLPEITLGVIPGAGGTQRLARLIGPSRAKELIFSGRPVHGSEAVAIGLASRAVPPDDVLPVALAWARELAAGPTVALAAAKQAIDRGVEGDLPAGLRREIELFTSLFGTEDQAHGMRSFLESGPGAANFTGR
jgi:enoyl-CoA hydratase/carnithine racemase